MGTSEFDCQACLQCLAITAKGGKVSAGDCTGRILIWHGLQAAISHAEAETEGSSINCTTVHWHSGPVRCLAFNLDASYLMSGGDEAVLVRDHALSYNVTSRQQACQDCQLLAEN